MPRRRNSFLTIGLAGLVLVAAACARQEATPPPVETAVDYHEALEQYRADREERLRAEDGWLTLVGLYWLVPGENRFGSDPEGAIPLDAPGIAEHAGTLHYGEDGEVRLSVESGSVVRVNDEPATSQVLRPDSADEIDVVQVGRLHFYVIQRGDRHGVRVKDPESPALAAFDGLDYFPIDETWHVDARFEPYDEPREIEVSTAVGTTAQLEAPGRVVFEHRGREVVLEPVADGPEATEFWFIFRDGTSGKETYGAGRYVWADRDGDRVDLDFNRSYNPPCAFTRFATCPLPPRENWLTQRIEAGERAYDH